MISTLAPPIAKVHRISPNRSGKHYNGRGFIVASAELYRCFHVVVRAARGEQPVRTTLVDAESRLGWQVLAPPADDVVLRDLRMGGRT
jgi:hypothetical protein